LAPASELYGFRRVDFAADDGTWLVKGRLTDQGRAALKKLEELKISIHLPSPSSDLLDDFLSAAQKPFLITGKVEVSESQADRIVGLGAVLGIDFDPGLVEEFIDRLEKAKELLGRRDLLVIYPTSVDGLDDAKLPLYFGLLAKGWAHKELAGSRRSGGGILGGNLGAIGYSPRRSRRR
jgi:hypothetical protein